MPAKNELFLRRLFTFENFTFWISKKYFFTITWDAIGPQPRWEETGKLPSPNFQTHFESAKNFLVVSRVAESVSQGVGSFWVESDSNTTSPSRIFGPTPKVQLNHFLHHIPKLGIPVEMVQFILTLIETENSCCLPRFPLVTSCYKIVDSKKKKQPNHFLLCKHFLPVKCWFLECLRWKWWTTMIFTIAFTIALESRILNTFSMQT